MRLLLTLVMLASVGTDARRRTRSVTKVFLRPKLVHTVREEFLSFAIDDGLARRNWTGLDLG